jgi:tRNA A22 N-methylase
MKVASPVGTTWEEQVDKKQEKNIEYPKRKYSLVAPNLHKKVSVQFAKKHTHKTNHL